MGQGGERERESERASERAQIVVAEEGGTCSLPAVGGACDVHRVPEVADEGHERERPALPPYGALYALHSAIYTLFY